MRFVSDPPITVKIDRMKERICWQHPLMLQQQIDQTRLAFESDPFTPELADGSFSFLAFGDSGSGNHRGDNPQRRVAEYLGQHSQDCQFVLHTGDVVYLVGSSEQYPDNFIKPYREYIAGGERPDQIAYDQMVFELPFLPTLGNHDYYDLPFIYGMLAQLALPLRRLFNRQIDIDVGWHGSRKGDAYARAFLDYLQPLNESQLRQHLDQHYTVQTPTGRCIRYVTGHFTRLPNRYYMFRRQGIDFFALDTNTFNAPQPLPSTPAGQRQRQELKTRREELAQQKQALLAEAALPNMPDRDDMNRSEDATRVDDIYVKIEQINEQLRDIEKQLTASSTTSTTDFEQLDWLRHRLVDSWQDPAVRGRVLYFHHPPYVTEATKWDQGQTLAVRSRLREVLDRVKSEVDEKAQGRALIDLVLCGHAHCFEHIRTGDTGHGDANIDWLICGGSGFSLRRQRPEGPKLEESGQVIAESKQFIGRSGQGSNKRRPYSALRIDVEPGTPPRFTVRPFVAEQQRRRWSTYEIEPIQLNPSQASLSP
ncbi:metallophosphoesterase [Romeria aff. gracilis LEGE 07310]|uniref:Metallophosphoesterase n=1 Tax=Vasconcelosia minhoensis LEGE 07310 TaxID=915328 RepID=A0A8J7A994_9CYAN|nr:metallophosphoesterase [Romeria gracilis]MBE9076346.1 metallophosphoesterase [Romeria aff. gracilis LEGE 07310]